MLIIIFIIIIVIIIIIIIIISTLIFIRHIDWYKLELALCILWISFLIFLRFCQDEIKHSNPSQFRCNCCLNMIIAELKTKTFVKITVSHSIGAANNYWGKPHRLLFMRNISNSNLIIIAHPSQDTWNLSRDTRPHSNDVTSLGVVANGSISKKCTYCPHFIIVVHL